MCMAISPAQSKLHTCFPRPSCTSCLSGAMATRWSDMLDPVPVVVRSLDTLETFILEVDLLDTVATVKDLIHGRIRIAPQQQKLIFERIVLQDDHTMLDYDVYPGCMLHTTDTRETSVPVAMATGKTISVSAVPSLRIYVFKARIQSQIGIHAREQRLEFEGVELCNSQRLQDYNILDSACLVRLAPT